MTSHFKIPGSRLHDPRFAVLPPVHGHLFEGAGGIEYHRSVSKDGFWPAGHSARRRGLVRRGLTGVPRVFRGCLARPPEPTTTASG